MEQKNKFYLTISGVDYEIKPHYKQLKKRYKKENNQNYFRESLDGKITLFNNDYLLVKNASLENTILFKVYRGEELYISASFNKSDCKFDHFKMSVELNLTYDDKYSKVLDAYENTYDLIKLAPKLTPITLTKRSVVQIYVQGERILSNYAGGTYWETDVDEIVDSKEELSGKYHFAKGPKYDEVDLEGFNYNINAAFRGLPDNNIWNATSKREVYGQVYKMPCSIVFTKVFDANQGVPSSLSNSDVLKLSDGASEAIGHGSQGQRWFVFDTYRIEIYTGRDGGGSKIYQSKKLYGKDSVFTLAIGNNLYPMEKINQPAPALDPTPSNFNLGEYCVEYQIWGRILCDVDSFQNQQGETIETYDLPRDDFATPRRNYKKCIGIIGFDSPSSVVSIFQNEYTSEEPTSYGINDFGEYFKPPYTLYGQYFYPLARNSWANTSMWVRLGNIGDISDFENYCSRFYKEYTLKDVYHIADVIKALLSKIDPSLTHEKTAEYSSFLYGHTGGTAANLNNCDLYITQKTNILKGEYDQAAQKAEIKFKQLMEMLRDCFRCYWFIDDQNRFRIEHVSFFINGMSYNSPSVGLNLTSKYDKFNKKQILYCQQEIEYEKSDLISRYEFAWMDNSTKVMGGDLCVDVNNKYVKKDKTEDITIDGFSADIDYMLFLPDDFSNDGFAIMLANSQKKVPIINMQVKDEKQYNNIIDAYVQNGIMSFNTLIQHYMEDMSGNDITCNNLNHSLRVNHVKRNMVHNISFPTENIVLDINSLIRTEIGNGYIEQVDVNIDTNLADVELRYEPS